MRCNFVEVESFSCMCEAPGLTFSPKRRKEQKTIQPEDSVPKGNEVQMTHETVWADIFSGRIFHELTRIPHRKQVGTGYKVSNVSAYQVWTLPCLQDCFHSGRLETSTFAIPKHLSSSLSCRLPWSWKVS